MRRKKAPNLILRLAAFAMLTLAVTLVYGQTTAPATVNSYFDSGTTGWVLGSGWTYDGAGRIKHTFGQTGTLTQASVATQQASYTISVGIQRVGPGGSVAFGLNSCNATFYNTMSFECAMSSGTGTLTITPSADFDGFIDYVVVVTRAAQSVGGLLRLPDGDPNNPAYGFLDAPGTGMYRAANTRLRFSTAGTFRWEIDGNGNLFPGAAFGLFGFTQPVTATTGDQSAVTLASTYTNTGAAGAVNITLPDNPPVGEVFTFVVNAAQSYNIKPAAGETIRDGGSSGSTQITANTVGSTITVISLGPAGSGCVWVVIAKQGTWTVS